MSKRMIVKRMIVLALASIGTVIAAAPGERVLDFQ
jgi:hypothetical protein